eukprot:gene12870-12970_t
MARFEGQVAIVTGGMSGIGAAAVARLRSEGAKVAVWDIAATTAHADHAERFDLTNPQAVQDAADATAGNPNASAYSTSKAAVIGLTKSLGKELAQTEIRVNCVTPAAVRTPIFDQMTQQHIDFMLSKIPMGRFGTTDEVASLICWLASAECAFSTGAVFDCSGGRATY